MTVHILMAMISGLPHILGVFAEFDDALAEQKRLSRDNAVIVTTDVRE